MSAQFPVNAVAFTFYIALEDAANPGLFKANPTLAAGDAKVSIDGGAFNNLATLPDVLPASGRAVRVQLSSGEMTGDNIFVQMVDAAGAEWNDLVIHIQPQAVAMGQVSAINASVITAASLAADSGLSPILSNTAQNGGSSTTIVLNAGASATDDFYKGRLILLTGGTGSGRVGLITQYVGATKTATVNTSWVSSPDNTTTFVIVRSWGEILNAVTTGTVTGNVTGSVGSVAGAVGSVTGAVGSVTGAVGSVTGNVDGNVTGSVGSLAAQAKTDVTTAASNRVQKNTALAGFQFFMRDSTNHLAATGLAITAQRSLDGAAFAACANSATQIGNGAYTIDLAAADLNGNNVLLRFTAALADDCLIKIVTQPT